MARAQFQKGQKVWVECVGAWATIEKVQPVWAKGFDEPVRVTYDVGLGREFAATELMMAAEDAAGAEVGDWRLLRARNKWQAEEDCLHHPQPGTYPVVVTDTADWGGWRVPGAEYDRDPEKIEFQARLIATAPRLMQLAESLIDLVAEAPDDAPPALLALARQARDTLRPVTEILESPPARIPSPAAAA
ncbi:hypothetical protein GCM10017620_12150 [Brevundimonas intermedia]|uniref:Uncharacterized protein n=1 Tax=Brevundimonas intermedia TaxID=74315 RepID=A0ABQ5T6N2_9CAUL|nr:hypothetical protein [Brevundimonas intermedia]GLK48242.1 hypothetical protein GCM10017620_12150 [Brevundimonas intermedia]